MVKCWALLGKAICRSVQFASHCSNTVHCSALGLCKLIMDSKRHCLLLMHLYLYLYLSLYFFALVFVLYLYCSVWASLNLIVDSIRRRENEAWRDNASRRTDTNARPIWSPSSSSSSSWSSLSPSSSWSSTTMPGGGLILMHNHYDDQNGHRDYHSHNDHYHPTPEIGLFALWLLC